MRKLVLFSSAMALTVLGSFGCSSGSKPKEESVPAAVIAPPSPEAETPAAPAAAPQPAKAYSPDSQSLLELNGASIALNSIIEESKKPEAERATVLNCEIPAADAEKLLRALRPMIEAKIRSEREVYTSSVSGYSGTKGFEACAAHCACGAFSEVVGAVALKDFSNPKDKRIHARNLKRLQVKASRQTERETLLCAHRQNWFCQSDLKSYLESKAR